MSDAFFRKIRNALASGPLHGEEAVKPDLAGARFFNRDLAVEERIKLFTERAQSSGSITHRVHSTKELIQLVRSVVPAGSSLLIDPEIPIAEVLLNTLVEDYEATLLDRCDEDGLFRAAAVITAVDFAIAETGSIAVRRGSNLRLASTVAEIHLALIHPRQIAADLMDLAEHFAGNYPGEIPPGITLISGPSKTADIELNLVIGVHGPAQMHMIIC